ncbi:hypothetical protein DOY81_011216 [Sarcophaga bullata]|nr:hypothetical protein DOY81_011216 [Sarcophaga bullata]
MASLNDKETTRRSKRVKNLEEEVEFILSQDESDEEIKSDANNKDIISKTPSKNNEIREATTLTASQTVLHELHQTPRRSCRKSIKPCQDYEEIVNKSLRFCTRKKDFLVGQKKIDEIEENEENEIIQPRWTPAKVGRISQKRQRKSRRNGKGNQKVTEDTMAEEEGDGYIEGTEQKTQTDDMPLPDTMHQPQITLEKGGAPAGPQEELIKEEDVKLVGKLSESMKNKTAEFKELFVSTENSTCKQENEEPREVLTDYLSETFAAKLENDKSTEDGKNFESQSTEENICIVFENNISNEDNQTENEENLKQNNSFSKQDTEDTFGSYLKSKEISISELGLKPIKDEDFDRDSFECKGQEAISQVVDEMPSLIIYDDDEEQEGNTDTNKLNSTFEISNSVELVENVENPLTPSEEPMETLQLSDDEFEETPKKHPRIVLIDTEMLNHILLSTPKGSAVKLSSTPKAWVTPKLPSTSKQSAKPYTFHTPCSNKNSFKFIENVKEKNVNSVTKETSNTTITLTTLKPKEIVLRGIRKRSLSACIDGNDANGEKYLEGNLQKRKQNRIVSFCSPANQTTIIDDIDSLMAQSIKKQKLKQTKDILDKNVTTRRKRSLSLDETMMSTSYVSRLPRPRLQENVSNKPVNPTTSGHKPLTRTKLPNFAAIHQKQFQKMENVVDHINRKQERSQILINSATKLKPVQKNVSIKKISNHVPLEKSKAFKKIDLATAANKAKEIAAGEKISNLPKPKRDLKKTIKLGTAGQKQQQKQQQVHKALKPSQTTNVEKSRTVAKKLTQQKPTSNMSTSLMVKPSTSNSFASKAAANTPVMSSEDKMASCLQQHMELFKGRGVSAREGGVTARKNDVLRGVRSNRRFELQMQHRRNMEL